MYAWLIGLPREEVTELTIPLHTVIRIDFDGTGALQEERYLLGPTKRNSDGQKLL